MNNGFAEKQLAKYGWIKGQGLGKDSNGRKTPIFITKKDDTRGLGDNSEDWSFEWWNKVYTKTLDNIKVSKTSGGEVQVSKIVKESTIPRNHMGIISTSESLYSLSDSSNSILATSSELSHKSRFKDDEISSSSNLKTKSLFYHGNFVKSSNGILDFNSWNKPTKETELNHESTGLDSVKKEKGSCFAVTSENCDKQDEKKKRKESTKKRKRDILENPNSNASRRLENIIGHINIIENKEWRTLSPSQTLAVRTNREIKWNGHGYKDTFFKFDDRGTASLLGNRFGHFSSKEYHELRPWLEQTLRINLKTVCPAQKSMVEIHSPEVNHVFYDTIRPQGVIISFSEQDRLSHGHGNSTMDIYNLRYRNFNRLPDAVIWPESHKHVEIIVRSAQKFNVGCIPYGGGSNYVNALECPIEEEKRMIVSLDMRQMNRILSLNNENMIVVVEAGAIAKDLEMELRKLGYSLGWNADSFEFSTVGGLAALRSSGFKNNMHGDFENSIINMKIVTPIGTIQKNGSSNSPPINSGPDITNLLFGSEGTLGVITELTFKLHYLTPFRHYVSIYFPSFHQGLLFLREIVQKKVINNLSGARLVDETGLQLVQAFNTITPTITTVFSEVLRKYYWKKFKNLKFGKMCLAAIVIDGYDQSKMDNDEKRILNTGEKFGGVDAGSDLGERMFFMSKGLPYLRDFLLDYYAISDYLDTSTSWSNIEDLVAKVKETIVTTCRAQRVRPRPYVAVRVDHIYETGASLTFTYGYNCRNLADPLGTLRRVEQVALVEILKSNGSISHHTTGIGKRKKECFIESLSELSMKCNNEHTRIARLLKANNGKLSIDVNRTELL
ncbi:10547_t:CDS:2 [Funneliformis geosporum]|uniref:Alkylglycerone-phosphate synthase n=1 Tax=Funneliformis geosporum TaxID=1117311 RepID=A0A9W4SP39_9GLOM|nr:10547_t:CDS:2 [Funneliformis geosporum]CAI2176484.1 7695_t:CDS:2 [Funneliformis geosporum]